MLMTLYYQRIHDKIHELEFLLSIQMRTYDLPKQALDALENAHDNLVHQVAEWVRTAEARLKEQKMS